MNRDKYREELQDRRINPSQDSWDILDKKLSSFENKKEGRNWMLLKIASLILVVISVGIYFYRIPQETKSTIETITPNTPLIAAPTSKENLNSVPDSENINEIKIVEQSKVPEIQNKGPYDSTEDISDSEGIALTTDENSRITHFDEDDKVKMNDSVSTAIVMSENDSNENQMINQEIDDLLHRSKIKLIANGQISSQKMVNANALLNSVEDDLNKDLRQKLIEKIVNTIKKDKEVATSKEN